jgi:hypothetical protein
MVALWPADTGSDLRLGAGVFRGDLSGARPSSDPQLLLLLLSFVRLQ